jgi:hypothetical protein
MISYENIWKTHMNRAEGKAVKDVDAGQGHITNTAVVVRCPLMDTAIVVKVIIHIL